jgi:hypothetical protein
MKKKCGRIAAPGHFYRSGAPELRITCAVDAPTIARSVERSIGIRRVAGSISARFESADGQKRDCETVRTCRLENYRHVLNQHLQASCNCLSRISIQQFLALVSYQAAALSMTRGVPIRQESFT